MIRASTGETPLTGVTGVSGVPAPPKAPAPEDFPVVPAVEPPRLERADQAGLVAAITAAVVVAAGLKWLSAGAIETAPILFVAVVAAAWWLDRRAAIGIAILSETSWTAAAFVAGATLGTAVSAIVLGVSLVAIVLFVSAARVRDARTANVPGMGLGLYLAKLIAEAHGGDLVASSPGRGLGSTFTLVLPLAGRPRHRPERQLPASSFWD